MIRAPDELRLTHSSDLHIDEDFTARVYDGDGTAGLRLVLDAAERVGTHLLLLAGDTFDNNRVGAATLERVTAMLADAPFAVVILPGNHDPVLPGSVHHRGGWSRLPNVSVFGLTDADTIGFPDWELELRGLPHRDYEDMVPLRPGPPRTTRWQVVMGHGHFEWRRDRATPLRPSWLISEDEIEATGADYVALGHWDRPVAVGDGTVPAFYSGSPELAGTINLVRLAGNGPALVTREPLSPGAEQRRHGQ